MQKTPKLAVFDIDGTLFRWSFFIDIVERLVKNGIVVSEAYTEASLLKRQWRNREVTYTAYLGAIIKLVEGKAMRGVAREDLMREAQTLITERASSVYVFTRELLRTVQEAGYQTLAISGSMKEVVDLFARAWSIDHVLATELEYDAEQMYTGKVFYTPVHNKGEALRTFVTRCMPSASIEIVVGDTMSDLSMLRLAKHPIAFNPENRLKTHGRAHGLICVTERKDTITVLSAPGEGNGRYTPRFFSETSLVNILPDDIGWKLKSRLYKLGFEHI